jgi:hypothetical protein
LFYCFSREVGIFFPLKVKENGGHQRQED